MSYLVLARKWRPQTFADLVGQEHISRTLSNAIASGRVHHAFLFTGARGVGKTSSARILAKALNCESGPTITPCNTCPACTEITDGQSVDVFEIDGASNTGVDDVRELRENVRYLPSRSRYKIFIIDEVHMLSINAFNALLKTLEEPPPHAKFIFATTEPHKIPITILSRCQRLDFRKISLTQVVQRLREIVDAEQITISDRALGLVARNGEGSMRDALSTLDQVIAFCGDSVNDDDVQGLLGMVDRRLLLDVADSLLQRDTRRALDTLQRVDDLGHSYRQFCRELIDLFRTLVLIKVLDDPTGVADVTADERHELEKLAAATPLDDLQRMLTLLLRADSEIPNAPLPRLIVEMALVRIAALPAATDVAALVAKLEHLERCLAGGALPATTATASTAAASRPPTRPTPAAASRRPDNDLPPEPPEPSEPPAKKSEAPAFDLADKSWPGLVDFVRARRKPRIASILEQARLLDLALPRLRFGLPKGSFACGQMEDSETLADFTELAVAYFGGPVRPEVVPMAADGGSDAPKSLAEQRQEQESDRAKRLQKDALEHPAIKNAIEVLEGSVVEVRPIDKGFV